MHSRTPLTSILSLGFVALSTGGALAQSVTMETVNSRGLWGTDSTVSPGANAYAPAMSSDGRFIGFWTHARNFDPLDTNGLFDAYVHDRLDGSTRCVSLSQAGLAGGSQDAPFLSADGRYVGFSSFASFLVPGDTNGEPDVFLRDMQNGTLEIVSLAPNGDQATGDSFGDSVSADGRFVAFSSIATNLATGDVPFTGDVFVRDRATGTTELISISLSGVPGGADSGAAAMTPDGRFVTFFSSATDLVTTDVGALRDVFLRDRSLGTTEIISVSSAGVQANGENWPPAISADGRFVAFPSDASNLVPGDTNGARDVFVRDRVQSSTRIVSVSSSGVIGNDYSSEPSLSDDGRLVAFISYSTNLVIPDVNGSADGFVHDLSTGTTTLVSRTWNGAPVEGHTLKVLLSGTGRFIAFEAWSNDVVPIDDPYQGFAIANVYVLDAEQNAPPIARYCTGKVNSVGCVPSIGTAGAPLASGFDSFFVIAHRTLPNKNGLLFWGLQPASIPFGGGTLCVQPPIVRTPVQLSEPAVSASFCENKGTFSFHFRQSYMLQHGLAPGDTVYAQYWSRDPGFAPPDNVSLSDALQFTICN